MYDTELTQYPKPLTENPDESFTLPSYLYTDPGVYALEMEKIFHCTWQYVAHSALIPNPGDYATAMIGDQNVFVMRGGDGELRAFYNVCQHRAHELLPQGIGNVERAIVCPYHAWTFEREGGLRGAPRAHLRPGFDKADYSLRQIRLEMFLDCAFINLDDTARPLAEQAPELEADIRARVPFLGDLKHFNVNDLGETDIAAGWKVVVDNYVECYHCDHAHPAFADLLCMDDYQHDAEGLWARQLGPVVRAENSAYDVDLSKGYPQSAFWYLWPNTTFNILPGTEEFNVSVIRPTGLETSYFGGHTLRVHEARNTARADYTANVLVPEDISLCESVQRGLKSKGYSQGPLVVDPERSGRGEHALHHFHRLVQQALS